MNCITKSSLSNIIILIIFVLSVNAAFSQEEGVPVINEVQSSNSVTIKDEEDEYVDWIEIFNPGSSSIDLTGYGLSDREEEPFKWVFPTKTLDPGQYLIVFTSGEDTIGTYLHTNFKINREGETIILSGSSGIVCDRVETGEIPPDFSYGRQTDAGPEWVLYDAPTPGASNNTVTGYTEITDSEVEVSLPGGFYATGISILLSSDSPEGIIRYTLDGSSPTGSSALYSAPISIDTTTVVRARVFEAGFLPGSTITNTYFIGEDHNMTVVSLSLSPVYLFDEDIGMYVEGKDEWWKNFNLFKGWERPAHVEFYEPDGSLGFSQDVGLSMSGLVSLRFNPQKSLAVSARGKYGPGSFEYQIFPDMPITEFKSFTLRNAGNEQTGTHFQCGLSQTLVKDTGIDHQAYRPSVVYINGVYWGIMNIREKKNLDYLVTHHGIDPDNVDLLEDNNDEETRIRVQEGDSEHFFGMYNFILENNMSDPANYDHVKSLMDVNNFINYFVSQIYVLNQEWPYINVKLWRPRTPGGRWRWMMFDVDSGMHISTHQYENMFKLLACRQCGWWSLHTDMFYKLQENQNFRNDVLNRFSDYLNTIFSVETELPVIEEIKNTLEPEIPNHLARWGNVGPLNTMDEWYAAVDTVISFAEGRPAILRGEIIEEFNLSGTAAINLDVSSSEAGKIKINSLVLEDYPWDGIYFRGIPVQLTARPNLRYRFVGWTGVEPEDTSSVEVVLTDSLSVTAVFEKIVGEDIVIDISQSPYKVESDQTILSGTSLTVEAGVELIISKNVSIYVNGEIHLNGTSDNPITIRQGEEEQRWGAICLYNTSKASTISNVIIQGASTGNDLDKFPAAVSGFASDITIDSVEFDNNIQSIFARGGTVTVKNCIFNSTNQDEHINIKEAAALVEGCKFWAAPTEDSIDYDTILEGIIRDNKIYSSNDDGIDIGDDCIGVLIANNVIHNCTDKAISVGEGAKDIRIERNILAGSYYGIAVKDSSNALIDHNTFYDNEIAVGAYEKAVRRYGGGIAVVTNSILSQSHTSALFVDELSLIAVSYSIADTELLQGEGNIQSDPRFVAPNDGDYTLQAGSPAIDTGDPESPLDDDGSRTDMGAPSYSEAEINLVINEINYRSSDDFNPDDWVEIYNPLDIPVDMSGWVLKDEDDAHVFVIPDDIIIVHDGYIVLCRDTTAFQELFPVVDNFIGGYDFGFGGGGELVRLYDSQGTLVDFLAYDDEYPWPIEPDGNGPTLALINPSLDNTVAENWSPSVEHGTPGAINDVYLEGIDDQLTPGIFSLDQNYPNPFNPSTTISFSIPQKGYVKLSVYDITGQNVATLVDNPVSAGSHSVIFDGSKLGSGVYLYRFKSKGFTKTGKMLLMK